jgi:1,4-dihydroxy-2-naphthoate polyprenyltransferase
MIPFPVVGVTRPNFLILTPICVSLGLGSALLSGDEIEWGLFAVALLGGLMAHASVNALNEYADFQSGLDFKTQRTPFSGGSGTLVLEPYLAPLALALGVASLAVTIGCGLYLFMHAGWGLIPIGITGVLIIVLYTGLINKHRFLVLIAPGMGFGPLMVVGTHYALTGTYSPIALLLSLIPFFLVNNLLLLNQVPDIEADRSVGRDNYAIAWQPNRSAWIYAGFAALSYLVLILGAVSGYLPVASLLGLLTVVLTYRIFVAVRGYNGDIKQLVPYLGKNVIVTLATPLLVFIGIVISTLW